ncbi:MAG: hypothetical protein HY882_11780, partial [Deltaproteobacteria bacterium]|nr:hypothetical protein [Deltaproteobacteria bacterium]
MDEIEINAWNDFARDLKKRVRWDGEKIEWALISALNVLPTLQEEERAELLKIGRVVAERSSKLAVTFLRIAPQAISVVDSSCRMTFLRWAAIFASQSRETLIDFLEKSPEILRAFAKNECAIFLHHGLHLAWQDWSLSFKYFLNLPRIRKEVPWEKFPLWFEQGLSLVRKSLPAAMAYYGLESKHSQ